MLFESFPSCPNVRKFALQLFNRGPGLGRSGRWGGVWIGHGQTVAVAEGGGQRLPNRRQGGGVLHEICFARDAVP